MAYASRGLIKTVMPLLTRGFSSSDEIPLAKQKFSHPMKVVHSADVYRWYYARAVRAWNDLQHTSPSLRDV
jgi:hypothetical protein